MCSQFCYTFGCFSYFRHAFKSKRNGYDTDGQDFHFLCFFSDDATGTSTCSSTHTCGYEEHLCAIIQRFANAVPAFFCILSCFFRFTACSPTGTQLQFGRYTGFAKGLFVGIANQECDVFDALAIHIVDCIATTASNAHHFDDRIFFYIQYWKDTCFVHIFMF